MIVVTLARVAFALERSMFSLGSDEMATAGMSRALAGGDWTMLASNVYRPGAGMLLAPLHALGLSESGWFRLALIAQALVGAAAVIPLHRTLARFIDLPESACALIAALALISPAALVSSAHLWAEPLVTLCFLGTVESVLRFAEDGRTKHAVVALGWSTLGLMSHGRLMGLVPVAAGVICWIELGDRRSWRVVSRVAAMALCGFAAAVAVHSWMVHRLWDIALPTNTARETIVRLRDPGAIIDATVGQVWYQLVGSALLTGFGVAAVAREAVVGNSLRRRDARLLLVLTAPLVSTSILFMSARDRADHLIYGRYNDAVLLPFVAIGAYYLYRFARGAALTTVAKLVGLLGAALLASTALLWQLHHLELDKFRVRPMIAGIASFGFGSPEPSVWVAAISSTILLSILVVAARAGSSAVFVTVLATLMMLGAVGTWSALRPESQRWEARGSVPDPAVLGVDADDVVYVLDGHAEVVMALVMQWRYPNLELQRFATYDVASESRREAPVFLLAPSVGTPLRSFGARPIWSNNESYVNPHERRAGMWVLDSSDADDLIDFLVDEGAFASP